MIFPRKAISRELFIHLVYEFLTLPKRERKLRDHTYYSTRRGKSNKQWQWKLIELRNYLSSPSTLSFVFHTHPVKKNLISNNCYILFFYQFTLALLKHVLVSIYFELQRYNACNAINACVHRSLSNWSNVIVHPVHNNDSNEWKKRKYSQLFDIQSFTFFFAECSHDVRTFCE